MGKAARRSKQRGQVSDGPVAAVGMREPCPCGSGNRYKACHGKKDLQRTTILTRPFEGLSNECDWVALREIVPAATASVRTTAEHGSHEITLTTVLPMSWAALHRSDGCILAALQTQGGSGDLSADLAAAILAATAAPSGTPIPTAQGNPGGPRLTDILAAADLDVQVQEGFDYWMAADADLDTEAAASLQQANEAIIPTRRLTGVNAAYWCQIGQRCHLRWVMDTPEETLLDGLARLHAAGDSAVMPGARYVGAFRAQGLLVPVWDLPEGTSAAAVENPAADFDRRLAAAVADTTPLTASQRGARAGLVSRQVTLR